MSYVFEVVSTTYNSYYQVLGMNRVKVFFLVISSFISWVKPFWLLCQCLNLFGFGFLVVKKEDAISRCSQSQQLILDRTVHILNSIFHCKMISTTIGDWAAKICYTILLWQHQILFSFLSVSLIVSEDVQTIVIQIIYIFVL